MRILFVSSSSGSRGGGELYLPRLAQVLVRPGVSVALWASTHARMDELCEQFSQYGEVLRSDYLNTYDRKLRVFGKARSNVGEVIATWKAWQPEIIHINKQNLEDGLELLKLADAVRVPAVCTIHLTQPAKFLGARLGRLRDWWSTKALRRFRGKYIVVDDARKPELSKLVQNQVQVEVIPNGVTIPTAAQLQELREIKRRELGLKNEETFVLAVGRLWEQKRPMLFLDWSLQLRKVGIGDRFCWVGEGHLQEAWDACAAKLGPWISRAGWQTDVLPYLAAADIFLHPARYEGLPFGILEAMAAGLPCVLSEEVCEGSFARMGEGCYVRASSGWEEKLRGKSARSEIGIRSREKVQQEYSLKKMGERYLELYTRISQ